VIYIFHNTYKIIYDIILYERKKYFVFYRALQNGFWFIIIYLYYNNCAHAVYRKILERFIFILHLQQGLEYIFFHPAHFLLARIFTPYPYPSDHARLYNTMYYVQHPTTDQNASVRGLRSAVSWDADFLRC